jgi:hypothetical protein
LIHSMLFWKISMFSTHTHLCRYLFQILWPTILNSCTHRPICSCSMWLFSYGNTTKSPNNLSIWCFQGFFPRSSHNDYLFNFGFYNWNLSLYQTMDDYTIFLLIDLSLGKSNSKPTNNLNVESASNSLQNEL